MQAEVQAAAQAVQEADYHRDLDPHLLEAVPVVVALLLGPRSRVATVQ